MVHNVVLHSPAHVHTPTIRLPPCNQVPSQSRPGAFSYLNVNTGERVAERPSRPASQGGQLPPGWKKVPSQSRPGEFVYMNVNTGERIACGRPLWTGRGRGNR